jgi:phospholipid/cholesterol/gamma-HCH transport system substrate-binding protein
MDLLSGKRNERRSIIVGVVVILAAAGFVAFALSAQGGFPIGKFTYARASFDDSGALLVGDDVRINSIREGRVEQIALEGNRAVVTMKLNGDVPLHRDAQASIFSRSGLGQKFVNLVPGTPESGDLGGAVIDTAHSQGTNELDTLFDVFDPTTRQALASTLRETGIGSAGHGEDLHAALHAAPELLPDLGTTAEALAAQHAALPELLDSARRLSGRFTGNEADISGLVRQFGSTVQALAVDSGVPLGDTLKALPGTLDHADRAFRALDTSLRDTQSGLTDLNPGAQSLGEATPDLRGVLVESRRPLDRVPDVSDQAVPAVDDLTDTIRDLRPLAPEVATALDRADTPLEVLAPYSTDIALFFSDLRSALSNGDGDKHWLRLLYLPSTDEVTGAALIRDPTLLRDPYPAPGEARTIRKTTILGGTR